MEVRPKRFLVVGATGLVGSRVAILLADRGHDVTALVREAGGTIRDPHRGTIRHVTGDLFDARSIEAAVSGIDCVIRTASGNLPLKRRDNARSVNDGVVDLVARSERAGVSRFVLSSVPTFWGDARGPGLAGKRRVEARLAASPMRSVVVRNPAFMDVFLVMGGFRRVANPSAHATTGRGYWFTRLWMALAGDLSRRWGLFLAPGGARHGTPMIATRDVAEMLVAAALDPGSDNLPVEAGGPEWLTWRQVGDLIAAKAGRERVRLIPIPAWAARINGLMLRPVSAAASNVMALVGFVAAFQPRWDSDEVVRRLGLPRQTTHADYLDRNYRRN